MKEGCIKERRKGRKGGEMLGSVVVNEIANRSH